MAMRGVGCKNHICLIFSIEIVGGLANEEKMYLLKNEISNIKWKIPGLAEMRGEGERLWLKRNGNQLYYFGETKSYRGLEFYIKKEVTKQIIKFRGITERIAVLKLKINKWVRMTIITQQGQSKRTQRNFMLSWKKQLKKKGNISAQR